MAPSTITFARFCSAIRGKGVFVLCLALCMYAPGSTTSAKQPRIVSFDAPGADLNPADYTGTQPSGINGWGVITGAYQSADTVFHGFLRGPGGEFITFQAPGADTTAGSYNGTYPNSINDQGAVTGIYADANGFGHAFLRSPDGKFTSFDVPGGAGFGTTPRGINLEGAVVGVYIDSNYSFHAFLRSPEGKFTTWDGPNACTGNGSQGCYGSGASNINAFGIVVGGFEDNNGNFVHHAFVRNAEGKLKVLDVPEAGSGNYQGTGCPGCNLGLNQLGAIAGTYIDANSVNHGFVRSPEGKFTTFDAPGAGTNSYQGTGCPSDCPVSINDLGAITASYWDANYVSHGYLRNPDGKIVTVDPPGSTYTFPDGINDWGVVTGYYVDSNNVVHGFLRLPN